MWIIKLDELSTLLCGFFSNLCKSVISPQSKSSIWGPNEIIAFECISILGPKYFVVYPKKFIKTSSYPHLPIKG